MVLQGESNVNSVILGIDRGVNSNTFKVFSDAPSSQISPDFPGTYFAVTLYDSEAVNSEGMLSEKESISVKGTDTPGGIFKKFDNIPVVYGDILRVEHRDSSRTLVYDEGKEISISKKEVRYFKLMPEGFVEILLAVPKVNEVTDQDTKVSGTGEPGAKVSVVVDGKGIGSGTVDDQGNFNVRINKQSAGKEVTVTVMGVVGNTSEPAKIIVKDTVAPDAPKVNDVTDQDTKVTGKGEKGSKVSVVVDGKEIGSGTVDDQGNFTVDIPKQSGEKEVVVTLTDATGNVSQPTNTKVKVSAADQDKLVQEAKQVINQLFTDSIQSKYNHNFTTLKNGAIQLHVTQQQIQGAEEKVRIISDKRIEKEAFKKEIERAQKSLKERENEQTGNLVQNGLFDSGLNRWKPWLGPGAKAPEVQADGGKSVNVVKINPNSSVEQILTGLEPNTVYELTLYAKTENGEKFSIGTKNTGTANVSVPIYSKEYSQAHLRFKTGPNSTTATIYVYKSGGTKSGYTDFVIAKKVMNE
ncbi:TPA: carbohydrate binding domain-containing protein [Bacillus cereus]|nr:carbohydrate binding domain-containing protein [Bacillus cereus]